MIEVNLRSVVSHVNVSGLEKFDNVAHMVEWLRRGSPFPDFIVADVENELRLQDAGYQLLSVVCKAEAEVETTGRTTPDNPERAVVTALVISFPLLLTVRGSDGATWKLDVMLTYCAANMDEGDAFRLQLDFNVVGAQALEAGSS